MGNDVRDMERLADEFLSILGRFSPGDRADQSMALAARALELGADLPPEPEWTPGQYAWVTVPHGTRGLAERHDDGWHFIGETTVYGDAVVLDVEPVVVLTVEGVKRIAAAAANASDGWLDSEVREAIVAEFAELELDGGAAWPPAAPATE